MLYEELKIGDIVCAKTENGDLDVNTLGQITKILPKSEYEDMKVIIVHHYYEEKSKTPGFDYYSPKELAILDVRILYHIMCLGPKWQHHENILIRRPECSHFWVMDGIKPIQIGKPYAFRRTCEKCNQNQEYDIDKAEWINK